MYDNLPHWASGPDYGANRGYEVYGGIDENGQPFYFGDMAMARRNNARWADAARYHNQAARFFSRPQNNPYFRVSTPFSPYADSWMRSDALYPRIEGFDPDRTYTYIDPNRLDAIRNQRNSGRFQGQ